MIFNYTCFEEKLGVTESVDLNIDRGYTRENLFASLLWVNETSLGDGVGIEDGISLLPVGILDSRWETLSANTDTFQDTVTSELMEDEVVVHVSGLLLLVGNDTTNEMGLSSVEIGHQSEKRFSVEGRDSLEGTTFLSLAALLSAAALWCVLSGDVRLPNRLAGSKSRDLEKLDKRVVKRILVLQEPINDVVSNSTSVVVDFEMGLEFALLLNLANGLGLAKMLLEELVFVSHISGLGNNALFFKKGHDTERLLNQLDSSLEIHTEIDKGPFDTFTLVFFLLKDEHVVVEELLESLVGVVDAKLLESVELENFETSDIEDTDKVVSGKIGGQSSVDDRDQPLEKSVERGLDDSTNGVVDLLDGLTLNDVFGTDFDLWSADSLEPILSIDTQKVGDLFSGFSSVGLGLFFSRLFLECGVTRVHERGSDLVDTSLFILSETENVEGLVSGVEFLIVIDRFDLDLSKRAPLVIIRISG